jgi:GT2 family glycosyltransferase
MKDTGAVIVTWNSEAEIGACLDSVLPRVERVVVVDNASSDGTLAEIRQRPAALLVSNPDNRGFAAAVNQGVLALNTPYVLILNPDTVLQSGVEPLVEAANAPGVAAAGGKLVDGQGRPQTGFSVRRFPTVASLCFEALGLNAVWPGNPVNRRYRCLDLDLDSPAEVDQPAGAFLLLRRDAWEALGGFDEGFRPVWFEDVDFLKRARDRGYHVRLAPAAVAMHAGGRSIGRMAPGTRELYWYASLLRYASKHFRIWGWLPVRGAVIAGSAFRMLHGVLSTRRLEPVAVYGRVICLACRGLLSTGERFERDKPDAGLTHAHDT